MLRSIFTCLSLAAAFAIVGVAGAADVSFYGVIKGENYLQNNPTTPFLSDNENAGEGKFFFKVFVNLDYAISVTNATLQLPVGPLKSLQLNESEDSLGFQESLAAPLFLDASYPNGTYVLTLKTKNDGDKTINHIMSGSYAGIPIVNNYNALQAVVATNDFSVTWTIPNGSTTNDFVQLQIMEVDAFGGAVEVYNSGQVGEEGALNGHSTTATIIADTLVPGLSYQGRLMVARGNFTTNGYGDGVIGVTAYTRRTEFSIVTSGTPEDTDAPVVINSTPFFDAIDVPVNAVVGFTFSERMMTNVSVASSIHWSGGVSDANFSYTWSPDSKTLYCVYNTSLPTSSTIQWTLNPTNTSQNLYDLATNRVITDYQGKFTTAASGSSGVKDVKNIFVYKGKEAVQTNLTGPVASGLFLFGMSANFTTFNTVTNASLTVPVSGNVLTPQREEYSDGDSFEILAKYDSQASLDAFFPNDVSVPYTVSLMTVHDGTKTLSRTLSGNAYPNLPNISNFTAAQTVDSANSFTVNWASVTGPSVNNIRFQIENESGNVVFETAQPGEPGALTGTATSATIPVGKLYPGRKYQARLLFIKVRQTDSTTYPGVTFSTAYTTETQFNLLTAGTPIQPQLTVQPINSGQFTLRLTGEPQVPYTIEASDTLTGDSWFQVWTQTADDNGHIDFTDGSPLDFPHLFYRAREGYSTFGN